MRQIQIQHKRFFVPLLAVLGVVLLLSLGIYYLTNNADVDSSLGTPVNIALMLLVYGGSFIVVPFLLVRFLYNLILLLHHGRKQGVKVVSVQTLFNPINFLLFPSLLNELGLAYRRRCIIAFILLAFLFGLVFYLAMFIPGNK